MPKLKSEELKKIIDYLDCLCFIIDKSGKLLFSNKTFEECGHSVDSLIPADIELKKLNEKTERETEVYCKGRLKKITVKITPVGIPDSSENVFLVEVRPEATDLGGVIKSWYKTIDALSEMVYVVDEDYNLIKLNSAVASLSGKHPKELIGKKCYAAVFGKEKICETCILPTIIALEKKEKFQSVRKEWDRSFLVSAARIKQGEYLFVMEDVTRIELLERNLAEIRKFSSIGAIINHIRNSVGNAVNAMKCSLQVLEQMYEELDDEKRKEYLKRSLDEIERIESLLFTLREFSRYEGIGSLKLNLTELILENKDRFSKYCKDKGGDFYCEYDEREFFMKGDKLLIVVALTKILDNALEAMENSSEKKILFKYSVTEEEAVINITDKGIGIAEHHIQKVAEPFFTTKGDRAGLGLYQAAKIIKTQGGDVTFSGEKDIGTTVKIVFRKH
jgi:signal transduction histidine kinase